MDQMYMKKVLKELLEIDSPSGNTKEAIEYLEKEFEKFDVPTKKTNKGALIATIEGEENQYEKMVSAHVDTLGAMVREIKDDGRLKILQIGGFAWTAVEGENVVIQTGRKNYTGTILPKEASIHVYSDKVRETLRTDENMEVRIDEKVENKEDVKKLGIEVGDFVCFEPRTIFTENGFVKSRFLDDKACIASMLGFVKYIKDHHIKPKNTIHLYISNYEEIGHGISYVPEKVREFIALDIGLVAPHQNADEMKVTICAKDSRTPYDLGFRKRLVEICKNNEIDYAVDVHFRYGSDASIGAIAGFDMNFACIGPGIDASHHYERTHMHAIQETAKLLLGYAKI